YRLRRLSPCPSRLKKRWKRASLPLALRPRAWSRHCNRVRTLLNPFIFTKPIPGKCVVCPVLLQLRESLMSAYVHHFFFAIYPYIALAVFLFGSLARFETSQYTWKSDSSQLLKHGALRWGSNLFHI